MPQSSSPDLLRRARVLVTFTAIMNLVILVCTPLDLANHAWLAAASEVGAVVLVDVVLAIALRRGKITLLAHFMTGMFVLNLVNMAHDKGGLVATEIAWQCAAIVFAVLVVGPRGALPWTLVACAGLGLHVRTFDATPWQGRAVAFANPVDYAIDIAVLYVATWGLAFAFDKARVDFLRRLESRNDEMRRVLEHARDALLTIDRDGRIGAERSRRADELLGNPAAGAFLWDVLATDQETQTWVQLAWEAVLEDVIPADVALAQMPRRVVLQGRTLTLDVTLIEQAGAVTGALVVLHDVTDEIARERAEQTRRDLLAVFEQLRADSSAVSDFVEEMDRLVASVVAGGERTTTMRDIHTIKGSAALFGVQSIAQLCHGIEERCLEADSDPSSADRTALVALWSELSSDLREWASAITGENQLSLARSEVDELRAALAGRVPHTGILEMVARWELMPLSRVLARLARQGTVLAKRLGKDIDFVVEPSTVRVDGEAFAPVFSSLSHAIRNAIDHGITTPDERVADGKPARGGIVLRATALGPRAGFVVEIRDDGDGVDWSRVRDKARACGLPAATETDLVAAIFSDGFSTRAEATEVSGRGIGLAALRDAAEQLGGSVTIVSERKVGSAIQLRLPDSVPKSEPILHALSA